MAELSNFLVAAIELARKSNDTITTVTITIHSRQFIFASHDASLLMQTLISLRLVKKTMTSR